MNLKLLMAGVFISIFAISCKPDGELQDNSLSPSETHSISQSVLDIMNKQEDCWNNGKIECFTSYYADTSYSCIMGGMGPICGRDSITAVYKKAYPIGGMGTLSFEQVSVQALDLNIALVRGKFILEYPEKPSDSGWFTLIFQKIKENWMIVADQTG